MKLGGYPVILLQLIICCGIFTTAEKRRSHFVLRFILCFLVSTALTLSFEYIEIGGIYRNVLRFLILYSIILGITFICFDVKFKDAVFDCTGGYALQHSIYCVIVIVTYFFPFNQLLRENIFLRYLCIHLPVTIPVAAVAYAVLIRPMKKKGLFNEKDISCVFLSVIVLFCAILLNEFSRFTIAGELNRFTTNVVCKAYSLLCCILVLFLQFFIFRLRKTEKDKEFIEYVFGQKKEQYNFSRETIDLINMKYHDLKHYIGVMKNLEDDERISMANEIEKYIKSYDGIVRTGQRVVGRNSYRKFFAVYR